MDEQGSFAMVHDFARHLLPVEEASSAVSALSAMFLPAYRAMVESGMQTGHLDTRRVTERMLALQWIASVMYLYLLDGISMPDLDVEWRAVWQEMAQRVLAWLVQQTPAERSRWERALQRAGLVLDLALGPLEEEEQGDA
jgi:hypothetical protein